MKYLIRHENDPQLRFHERYWKGKRMTDIPDPSDASTTAVVPPVSPPPTPLPEVLEQHASEDAEAAVEAPKKRCKRVRWVDVDAEEIPDEEYHARRQLRARAVFGQAFRTLHTMQNVFLPDVDMFGPYTADSSMIPRRRLVLSRIEWLEVMWNDDEKTYFTLCAGAERPVDYCPFLQSGQYPLS